MKKTGNGEEKTEDGTMDGYPLAGELCGSGELRRQKDALRREIRLRARVMDPEKRAASDRRIAEAVLRSVLWREAESVFLYVSVGSEPDTRGLLVRALGEGKRVYVPKCLPGPERIMLAVRIRSAGELVPGTLGIPEPLPDPEGRYETAEARELDLMLIPCVTADRSGNRLGHGAGYYDRFLAPLAESLPLKTEIRRPALVCLCREELLSDRIPADGRDVRMDYVVPANPLP